MIKLPVAALIVVVALLGGFYGGYKLGGGGTASAANSTNLKSGNGSDFAGRGVAACPSPGASPSAAPSGAVARRGATGTVTNLDSTSLTVHDARCHTDVKVTFDQSVIIRKSVVGQSSDLSDNQTVVVTGTRQPDGSIKASSITIGTGGSGGGFGGGSFGASPPSS
jgi:hypothetical protein